jgi:hypothetical protein
VTDRFRRGLAAVLGILLAGVPLCRRAQADEINGTIVSIRGNILAVRPSLRPRLARVSFGEKTVLFAYERTTLSVLKPGMRVALSGRYSQEEGLHARWIEAAERPIGYLAQRSKGLQVENGGWARGVGTLRSVEPFVFRDDAGKEFTAKLDELQGVWHDFLTDRSGLLIGTRISAEGTLAPDGVLQAASITPDRNYAKAGTMFGEILAVRGETLEIRPRYTSDTLPVTFGKRCILLRQVSLDPDSIKVGDKVTFWGQQHNHPWDSPKSPDLLATALLVGKNRYPASEGQEGGVFLTGRLASIDPVRLTQPNGRTLHVIIPGQMPIARLDAIRPGDLKPGRQVMLVLSRRPDGRFQTSHVILDAAPYVGYGG